MALMMTAGVLALMSSYLVPVTYDANSLLVPSLLARIQLLENNARTAPRLAFGAGLLARGAGVIGSRTFQNYMDWRKLNPPTYAASGRSGWAASSGSSGWGGWAPSTDAARRLKWLHEMYERNSVRGTQRGHRAIDFLAFAFARSRARMRVRMAERLKLAQEWLARRAARAEAQAAAGDGWGGDGWGAEVVSSGGWSGGGVTVVQEPAPVVTEVVAPAPVPVHYSSVEEPVGYGPAYGPTTYDSGPSYGPSYGPSSYGSHDGPSSSYGSGYSSGSDYGGPSKGQYYSSAAAAGHSSYGGGPTHGSYGSYSSYAPSRTSASSSSRGGYSRSSKPKREQEQLSPLEFMSLMDWAEGKPLDYTPAASGPRNVRIKRQHTKPNKTRAPVPVGSSASAFLPGLVDDVGRFFTVIEFLDENKCLQKFVCNVHSRARSYLPAPMVKGREGAKSAVENMSPFESSIVAAFKVLDTFMPVDDESYRGYRDAALAGAKAANETACTKQYRSCKYSTAEIIEMNDQIEAQALAAEKLKAKAAKTTKAPTTVSTTTTTRKPAVKKQPKNKKKVTTTTSTTAATTTTTPAPTTLLPEEYEYDDESEETSTEEVAA